MATERIQEAVHEEQEQWACGWCKGFVHEELVSDMRRYVHDEPPLTEHEVLPYPISWSGRQWQAS